MLIMAFVYYKFTKDTLNGNYSEITRTGENAAEKISFWKASADVRVWALAIAYACCFGMEITFDGVAALYFFDNFKLDEKSAGLWAGAFGFMNIFARAVGGILADKVGNKFGMRGKGILLAAMLLLEGIGILAFAAAGNFTMAILAMITFAMFLKMANGTTYAIVPFVNKKAVGTISGIVGAGGNLGGMLMGFLFKSQNISYLQAFQYIGMVVGAIGILLFVINFAKEPASISEKKVLEMA